MSRMILIGVVGGLLAACGGAQSGGGADRCSPAVDNATGAFVKMFEGKGKKLDANGVAHVLGQRCREDAWSDALVSCLASAPQTKDGMDGCEDKFTDDQKHKIKDALHPYVKE